MYKALKNCKFDRKYSVGEFIEDSVIDPKCLLNAVAFGFIEHIEEPNAPEEPVNEAEEENDELEGSQEASEADSSPEAEKDEETSARKKGRRKKGNEAV